MGFPSCLPLAVLISIALTAVSPAARADTNEWLKPTSGYWEEPYWSLGRLPTNEDAVLFENPGFKALGIGYNTVTNAPESLSILSLTIDAPSNSLNQLLLNYAGFTVPLLVNSNLVVGTNGSLVSYSSALVAGNFYLGAKAQFLDHSAAAFTNVFVGSDAGAELDLSNSVIAAGLLQLGAIESSGEGLVNQSGGTNLVGTLAIHPGCGYTLADGGVITGNVLEMHTLGFRGDSHFTQTGGTANFGSAGNVLGSDPVTSARLALSGGRFQAANLSLYNGSFVQLGGTNVVGLLQLMPDEATAGAYTLSEGLLVSTNLTAGVGGFGSEPAPALFTQTGGVHTNGSLGHPALGSCCPLASIR